MNNKYESIHRKRLRLKRQKKQTLLERIIIFLLKYGR